jgi:MFS family permease
VSHDPSAAVGRQAADDAPGAWYVVILLALVYALNIADRYVMSTLIEPIKADLGLSDAAVGWLTGASLATFYMIAGIPIATLADRANRTRLVGAALTLWSLFTALCGLTQTYWQLFAMRILVGVGEAGGTPPSTSLISDYFGWRRRAFALSVFSLGASVGSMLGSGAGLVADRFGWRSTFFVLGIPGVVLALVLTFTVKEPARGRLDARPAATGGGFPDMLRLAARSPALLHCYMGSFLYCLWAWGLMWWTPSYLVRSHGMTLGAAGESLALIHGIGGTAVLIATSVWMRALVKADIRAVPRAIALACSVGAIPSIVAYLAHDRGIALAALWAFIPVTYVVFGPPYALMQNLAPANLRAQAMSLLLFSSLLGNLIVAPALVGRLSDLLEARYGAESLRMAMLPLTVVGFWSAVHWWLAGERLRDGMARAGTLGELARA